METVDRADVEDRIRRELEEEPASRLVETK
jgi:hypothetical protein